MFQPRFGQLFNYTFDIVCVTSCRLTALSREIQLPWCGDRLVRKLTKTLLRIPWDLRMPTSLTKYANPGDGPTYLRRTFSKSAAMSQNPTAVQNPADLWNNIRPPDPASTMRPRCHEGISAACFCALRISPGDDLISLVLWNKSGRTSVATSRCSMSQNQRVCSDM